MKVILMCTITANGMIAKETGDATDWTTKGNKRLFAVETKKAGVVIMGHTTHKLIGRPLPDRLNVVMTSKAADKASTPGVVEFADAEPKEVLADLEKRGFDTAFVIGGGQINSLFLKAGSIDEVWLIVEPVIFGKGLGLFTDAVGEVKLHLMAVERLTADLLFVKYAVI